MPRTVKVVLVNNFYYFIDYFVTNNFEFLENKYYIMFIALVKIFS